MSTDLGPGGGGLFLEWAGERLLLTAVVPMLFRVLLFLTSQSFIILTPGYSYIKLSLFKLTCGFLLIGP